MGGGGGSPMSHVEFKNYGHIICHYFFNFHVVLKSILDFSLVLRFGMVCRQKHEKNVRETQLASVFTQGIL